MDTAPEVRLKVRTWPPGGLVDREIRGGEKRGRDATQPAALIAIRTQDGTVSICG
jgi:hypothetical protein